MRLTAMRLCTPFGLFSLFSENDCGAAAFISSLKERESIALIRPEVVDYYQKRDEVLDENEVHDNGSSEESEYIQIMVLKKPTTFVYSDSFYSEKNKETHVFASLLLNKEQKREDEATWKRFKECFDAKTDYSKYDCDYKPTKKCDSNS